MTHSMQKEIKIDLPTRTEQRYVVLDAERFLALISPAVERKKFSDNDYVQTIYFNNEDHVVPFGLSLKARRYLPSSPDYPVLDNSIYFLDLKSGLDQDKQKTRLEVSLEEATKFINKNYHFSEKPLRPYVAVVYWRRHYLPKNTDDIRLTLDTNLRYFFFPPNQKKGIEIGREDDFARLEIKIGKSDEKFNTLMSRVIREMGIFPVISKKSVAYRFLGKYLAQKFGKPFYKELKDCEIEAKLETDSEKILPKIKNLFRKKNNDFQLPNHFPYTTQSASINRYYKNKVDPFKALLRGNVARIVRKEGLEIINDKFGLSCILKRKEIKGNAVPINSELLTSAELLGELHRRRKAFYLANIKTGRFYHISLDCCSSQSGILYEIEIEYTGRYLENKTDEPQELTEKLIIDDIAQITKILLDKFPELKPSQLTKQAWLGIKIK